MSAQNMAHEVQERGVPTALGYMSSEENDSEMRAQLVKAEEQNEIEAEFLTGAGDSQHLPGEVVMSRSLVESNPKIAPNLGSSAVDAKQRWWKWDDISNAPLLLHPCASLSAEVLTER